MKRRASRSMVLALVAAVMLTAAPVMAQQAAKISEQEASALGTEAYIYGYPLVTMELTRRVSTNVVAPEGSKAPMGQFANLISSSWQRSCWISIFEIRVWVILWRKAKGGESCFRSCALIM